MIFKLIIDSAGIHVEAAGWLLLVILLLALFGLISSGLNVYLKILQYRLDLLKQKRKDHFRAAGIKKIIKNQRKGPNWRGDEKTTT